MSVKISWCWEFPAEHLQWENMPLTSLVNWCWQGYRLQLSPATHILDVNPQNEQMKSLFGVTKQYCRVANTQSVGMAAIERWLFRTENNNDRQSWLFNSIVCKHEQSWSTNIQNLRMFNFQTTSDPWSFPKHVYFLLLLPPPVWKASTRGQFRKDDITVIVPNICPQQMR